MTIDRETLESFCHDYRAIINYHWATYEESEVEISMSGRGFLNLITKLYSDNDKVLSFKEKSVDDIAPCYYAYPTNWVETAHPFVVDNLNYDDIMEF